ncbi:MAG: DUF814 domain-containing protein, partial [Thermoplasmata archaeon]|nr:DUF814 domain-containing protein [Thermoplasmata archaeon]
VRLEIRENASVLYEKAKRAKHKSNGAREALAEAEKELKRKIRKAEKTPKDKKQPTKSFWFDRFRWFVSSGGNLVLAGRDTRSNDLVVKKHLKDQDLYAHADLSGAPSVVIKDGSEASQETLVEACVFAICHSKAWKSGFMSGSAYWVKPDQVSKTPEPGEFLPRGAFIIRGKRNYSKKLDMRLAVGEVIVEGERKVMCAPEGALAAHTDSYHMIVPGETKRSDFAKKLSEEYNVPIEEIDKILPPGDVREV